MTKPTNKKQWEKAKRLAKKGIMYVFWDRYQQKPKNLEELIEEIMLNAKFSYFEKDQYAIRKALRTVALATLEATRNGFRRKRSGDNELLASHRYGWNANTYERERKEKEFMGEGK